MNPPELRFLVDVGVGKGIEKYLMEEGYDTKAVRDIDPRMEDEEIKDSFCVFQNNRLRIKKINR